MIRNRKLWVALGMIAVLAGGYVIGTSSPQAIAQDAKGGTGGPRYTVVETDVTNLLVVDNQVNTIYFYTVEKDAPPGSDLHLRGSLDLNEVGKPVLKPKKVEK